ncbi:molybdopterin-binding protein [Mesorhizobium sp. SP-1A]|uniref:molybdopterin-binding protein n=1 Tax=Mesorhizobium sp. SP-1A TaxID=3077840 RepID=UPI0028F74CB3|nr:molybdopterin-binding protein [Mesorhizobium sp. SP-1A]
MKSILKSLESIRAELVEGLAGVAPSSMTLAQARGRVAAETAVLATPLPERNKAVLDGWALRSLDLAGASSYSPVPLPNAPVWVEAGQELPDGCDCVLRADMVDCTGPFAQAFAEAPPGEGIRRAGEDIAAGRPLVVAGRRLDAADLLALRALGHETIPVRVPRVLLLDVAARDKNSLTSQFIGELLEGEGADVSFENCPRDAASIAGALDDRECDMIVTIGGTGSGHGDATADALRMREALIAHGIALRPGQTAAVGKLGAIPVVALPGAPDHAFAVYHALVRPALDRLAGRLAGSGVALPLARKISSMVGIAEIALVRWDNSSWLPLSVGDLPLDHLRLADAVVVLASGSEGHAAGTQLEAFLLRDI